VEVNLERTATSVRLTVRDGGPGIPEAAMNRLFQRYERLTPGKGAGLGLGLFISRHIVDLHRGRVWAENHPCGGAIFGFELPTRSGVTSEIPVFAEA
jgi:signal transduction histidine kinase